MISAMADFLIRNLDKSVADRLRQQARQRGVSLAEEIRRILTLHARTTRAEQVEELRAFRARQKPHRSNAVDLIREDRDR
jgi:plasmid stability protein